MPIWLETSALDFIFYAIPRGCASFSFHGRSKKQELFVLFVQDCKQIENIYYTEMHKYEIK